MQSAVYVLEASFGTHRIADPIRDVFPQNSNVEENFLAYPRRMVELLFDRDILVIGQTVELSWAYRHLDDDELLHVEVNRGSGYELIDTVPLSTGWIDWSVPDPAVNGATLRIRLDSNAAIADTHEFNIIPVPQINLPVTKEGAGAGLVTSEPAGIDCGPTCEAGFDEGTLVTLTAAADPGSVFVDWSGGYCFGVEPCAIRAEGVRTVTATFLPERLLNLDFTGSGSGRVTSIPERLDCTDDCSVAFIEGEEVTLQAAADNGNLFVEWNGDCIGAEPCVVIMDQEHSVGAFFIADSDGDGIDDDWEILHFGSLDVAGADSDYDGDGYSDLQEYLNGRNGEKDPNGKDYDPKVFNAPHGTGWEQCSKILFMSLPAILKNAR